MWMVDRKSICRDEGSEEKMPYPGSARADFAAAVAQRTKELLSAHTEMSELAAFREATRLVAEGNKALLAAYRESA